MPRRVIGIEYVFANEISPPHSPSTFVLWVIPVSFHAFRGSEVWSYFEENENCEGPLEDYIEDKPPKNNTNDDIVELSESFPYLMPSSHEPHCNDKPDEQNHHVGNHFSTAFLRLLTRIIHPRKNAFNCGLLALIVMYRSILLSR